jgi:hypothetical protein
MRMLDRDSNIKRNTIFGTALLFLSLVALVTASAGLFTPRAFPALFGLVELVGGIWLLARASRFKAARDAQAQAEVHTLAWASMSPPPVVVQLPRLDRKHDWSRFHVLVAVGICGSLVLIFVIGSIQEAQGGPGIFDLKLGQTADISYTCQCPTQDVGPSSSCSVSTIRYLSPPPNRQIPPGLAMNAHDTGLTGIPTELGTWDVGYEFKCYYRSTFDGKTYVSHAARESTVTIRVHK